MRKLPPLRYRLAIAVSFICLLALGCTQWNATTKASGVAKLPIPQMSRDSIGIEVATVTVSAERQHMLEDIFSRLDEQVLPPETRQVLALNGFRAGVLGAQLPENLKLLLLETSDRKQHPTADTHQYQDDLKYIQCRPDSPRLVKLWKAHRDIVANYNNGEFATSEELEEANCHVRVSGTQNGSLGATIQIVPEIEFGPLRQQYVVQDNAFHIEAKRDVIEYDQLAMDLPLRSGEVLMVTCDSDPKKLGQSFFVEPDYGSQKLLLIRLSQTQFEDYFETDFSFDD